MSIIHVVAWTKWRSACHKPYWFSSQPYVMVEQLTQCKEWPIKLNLISWQGLLPHRNTVLRKQVTLGIWPRTVPPHRLTLRRPLSDTATPKALDLGATDYHWSFMAMPAAPSRCPAAGRQQLEYNIMYRVALLKKTHLRRHSQTTTSLYTQNQPSCL